MIKKAFLKIVSLLIIIGMNWSAISLISGTDACFNDVEMSGNNILATGILNFELNSENDFSPEVILGQKATRKIEVENHNSTMGFKYEVRVEEDPVGGLCDYLYLEDGTSNEPLNSFVSGEVLFSEKQEWTFKASLDGTGEFWQNQECKFNLIFEGQQEDCDGFSDIEIIENTVTAGEFGDHLLISKVYYDVCDKTDGSCGEYKGKEPKHEWIELYNPTSQTVNLKNWQICNSDRCETINPNNDSVKILPLGYAIMAHDASILKYWNILNDNAEATVIYQLGGNFQMDNDRDMLVLKDPAEDIIDQMNWEIPSESWNNYNDDLWNPGVSDVAEGHMLGRVPVGLDTDLPTDWYDLELPSVTVTYPSELDIVWHIGGDYDITWDAFNNNIGDDSELTIDIYYSNDNGKSWDVVKKGIENDGSYLWKNIRPFIFTENNKPYSTLSSHARIKVVAIDHTRNFMLRNSDMSDNDFCPPTNCSLFTLEEIKVLVEMGILDKLECSMDDVNSETENDNDADANGSTALRDNGANDDDDDDDDANADDMKEEENDSDTDAEDGASDGDDDTDADDMKEEDDEKAKPETGDNENDDANEDDDDADADDVKEDDDNDADADDMKEEENDSDTDAEDGASDEDDNDDAEGSAQDDGTDNGLNKNMVDSVQASM